MSMITLSTNDITLCMGCEEEILEGILCSECEETSNTIPEDGTYLVKRECDNRPLTVCNGRHSAREFGVTYARNTHQAVVFEFVG